MASAAVRRYWSMLVSDGCVICGAPAEIAHCHGGSITERLQEPKAKGKKLAWMDWLALPLCPRHHRDTFKTGLDYNVSAWEARHGSQADWIDVLVRRHGIDAWNCAREARRGSAWDGLH